MIKKKRVNRKEGNPTLVPSVQIYVFWNLHPVVGSRPALYDI